METARKLQERRIWVERALEKLLTRGDTPLYRAMRYAVMSGGKRFRPLLLLAAGECFNQDPNLLKPFACAVELIHNYSLIHDDLPSMDNDEYRRGLPTCHKAYGENIAVLAGDALLTLAFQVMAEAGVPERLLSVKIEVITEITKCSGAEGMVGGQELDITFSKEKAGEDYYMDMISKKTGALILASVKAGALLGEAPSCQLAAVEEYGAHIGKAFQIRDDLLDADEVDREEKFPRPNILFLWGRDKAADKLEDHLESAVAALESAGVVSESLVFLARKLMLERKNDERNPG